MEQARINFIIDKETKLNAEEILNELGLNLTTALNLYLKAIVRENGIPFKIKLDDKPNKETLEAFEEYENAKKNGTKLKEYDTFDDLLKDVF